MVAYMCHPLFAYVSNLTIIITQNPRHVSLSLAIWLLATSQVHDTGISPLGPQGLLSIAVSGMPARNSFLGRDWE